MPDKMTIRFNVENGNTVSKFAVNEKGQITFANDADAGLTVEFKNGSPICQGNQPVTNFPVDKHSSKMYQVCDKIAGSSYKYTATVAGANQEDPIVIIERSGWLGSIASNPGAALGVGVALGIAVTLISQ